MQTVISSSIAALLLAHGVLGCCWQRAHQAGCQQQSVAVVCDCCEHEESSSQQESVPDKPCKCRWECHGICVYLPEKPSLESRVTDISVDFVAAVTGADIVPDAGGAAVIWLCGHPPNVPPGMRLHLLCQILLI